MKKSFFVAVVTAIVTVFLWTGPAVGVSSVGDGTAARSSLKLVALGDSYSAGVGVGGIGSGCDRDRLAWAPRAYNEKTLIKGNYSPGGIDHVACSGYTIEKVISGELSKVTPAHNVASITIGGNDIGFGAKVAGCVIGDCGADTYEVSADIQGGAQTWDGLQAKLVNLYRQIRQRMSKTGFLYVLTYPIPFALGKRICAEFKPQEQLAANALVTKLDDTIAAAVAQVNAEGASDRLGNVVLVDWRPSGGRVTSGYMVPAKYQTAGTQFDVIDDPTYGLCNPDRNDPNIQGLVNGVPSPKKAATDPLGALGNSFHPGTPGYWRAAKLFYEALHATQPAVLDDARIPCGEGCSVTGQIPFQHPTWGASTLVTTVQVRPQDRSIGTATAFDSLGTSRYQRSVEVEGRSFTPALQGRDGTGNLFVRYNPGRYDGLIVLVPVPDGLSDLGSFPPAGSYAGVFYGAAPLDVDGRYAVYQPVRYEGGSWDRAKLWIWDGSSYPQVFIWNPDGSNKKAPGQSCPDEKAPAGASDITTYIQSVKAAGVSCADAIPLIRSFMESLPERWRNKVTSDSEAKSFNGYACVREYVAAGSGSYEYQCSKQGVNVSWGSGQYGLFSGCWPPPVCPTAPKP